MHEPVDFLDNAESAEVLGWDPTWLDLPPDLDVTDELVSDAVAFVQDDEGQPVTGVLDAVTWQRLEFWRTLHVPERDPIPPQPSDAVIIRGERVPVPFPVVTWDEPGGREIQRYYKRKGKAHDRYGERHGDTPSRVVVHWTGTKSVAHTWRAAWNAPRGVSTHFEIDGDGTIFQLVDLGFAAYHAGKRWLNKCAVGVDLTLSPARKRHDEVNAALEAQGLRRRPIVEGVRVRGWKPGPFLGATPEQLASLRQLMRWLHAHYGIPMTSPDDPAKPLVVPAVCGIGDATPAKLPPGWLHHAHFKGGRWDTACVSLPQQLDLAERGL
jgi:hypothetical protein